MSSLKHHRPAEDLAPDRQTEIGQAPAAAPSPGAPDEIAHPDNWGNHHPVDIRLSIPYGFGRFYITLVAGTERRSAERLVTERRKHPLVKLGNLMLFGFLGTVLGLALLTLLNLATVSLYG